MADSEVAPSPHGRHGWLLAGPINNRLGGLKAPTSGCSTNSDTGGSICVGAGLTPWPAVGAMALAWRVVMRCVRRWAARIVVLAASRRWRAGGVLALRASRSWLAFAQPGRSRLH